MNLRIVSPLLLLLLLGCAGSGATPGAAAPKIYVGNFKDNTVSVIDSGSRKVVATIPVAAGPHGMGNQRPGDAPVVGAVQVASVAVGKEGCRTGLSGDGLDGAVEADPGAGRPRPAAFGADAVEVESDGRCGHHAALGGSGPSACSRRA